MEATNYLDEPIIEAQIAEKSIISEMAEIKSIRVNLEKLDGGYISDATGARKIYAKKGEILEDIGMPTILDGIDHNEYKLHIDLIPKEKYEDYVDAMNFGIQVKETQKANSELVAELIEKTTYNPNKTEQENLKEIKVTKENAYSSSRLKALDWKMYIQEMPLSVPELAEIAGVPKSTLYPAWTKVKNGTATFNYTEVRIYMTVLAKYFEAHLGIRTSTKEQNALIKDKLLNAIRELQLVTSKNKFISAKELAKKLAEMQNILLS